jgi:hypothetical protein
MPAIFALAVYALSFFVALHIGMAASQGGTGVIGALLIGAALAWWEICSSKGGLC